MKKLYFLGLTLLASAISFGQEFTATYNFADMTTTSGTTDPTPVPTVTGLTFGSFSVVNPNLAGSVTGSAGAGRFAFPNQPLGATNNDNTYANLTGSIDLGVYYQVTITPNSGTTFNLSGLTFKSQRSGTGIRTFSVRSSIDNYASNLAASVTSTSASVESGNIFFVLSDANTTATNISEGNTITTNYTNLSSAVTFRFYAWNAEAAGGNFSIDDVVISGNVTSLSVKQNTIAGLKLYPNPVVNGTLFIETAANAEKTVAVYDVLGKNVLNASTTENDVNVSSLRAGVYMVKITEEGKTATRKLVIK